MLERDFTRVPNYFIRTQKYLSEKAVKAYLYICSCVNTEDARNGDEKAFPTVDTIHEKIGFSKGAVSNATKELEILNLVTKERRFNKSNYYRLSNGLTDEELEQAIIIIGEMRKKKNQELNRRFPKIIDSIPETR